MSSLSVPQSRVDVPTRADAVLEVIQQPLYSCAGFVAGSAIQFSTEVFSYRIGQNVPGNIGAVASTINHTNMTQAGTLAVPKVYEFRAIRQVVSQLVGAALTTVMTVTNDSTPMEPNSLWQNTLFMFWGTSLKFHVGEKDYLEGVPSFLTPGNVGIGGVAALASDDQADAEQQQVVCVNGAGRAFNFEPYAIFLPSQQQFFAQIRATQPTPPTVSAADTLVYVIADGVLGREVM